MSTAVLQFSHQALVVPTQFAPCTRKAKRHCLSRWQVRCKLLRNRTMFDTCLDILVASLVLFDQTYVCVFLQLSEYTVLLAESLPMLRLLDGLALRRIHAAAASSPRSAEFVLLL
jgi:hypothetical protein